MEKKVIINQIVIFLAFAFILNCSNKKKDTNSTIDAPSKYFISYDTLFFGKEMQVNIDTSNEFYGNNVELSKSYILFSNKKLGKSFWIDSILYLYQGDESLIGITRSADGWNYSLIKYDGDSLIQEIISKSFPKIKEHKIKDFFVLNITDSLYNSGYLIKSQIFYKIGKNGIVEEKLGFFPTISEKEKKYDFDLTTYVRNDTFYIIQNFNNPDSLDKEYRLYR